MITESGDISVDMIGGGAHGDNPFNETLVLPEAPDTLPVNKTPDKGLGAIQGYGLLDVAANEYVAHGFPSFANDGKMRDSDPPERGGWETVSIDAADLAAYVGDGKEYRLDIFDSYLGGWGWIGFDTVKLPTEGSSSLGREDINQDGRVDASDAGLLFAAWTGEAPTPAAGDATASYNWVSGLIEISANGVVNAFVESASGGLTPGNADAAPAGLLASDNASRVGLTGFGGINVTNWKSQNTTDLAADDLTLVVGPALGVPSVSYSAGSGNFAYVPEPASIGLLGIGLCGLLAARRRAA